MPSAEPKKASRRRFILGGLGVAGALVVGWGLMPPRQRLNASTPLPVQDGQVALNGWIKIARDGTVTVAMPHSELGQGIHTALAMLVAPEPAAMARGFERLLREPALRARLGAVAQEKAQREYSLRAYRHKLKLAYTALQGG